MHPRGGKVELGCDVTDMENAIIEPMQEDDIDSTFEASVQFLNVCKDGSITLPAGGRVVMLKLYGLYKQATSGICNQDRPSRLQMKRVAMYESWRSCGTMSAMEARRRYVHIVKESFDCEYEKYLTEGDTTL